MPTYQKCDASIKKMAHEILNQFESHTPIVDAGVTTDLLFAYGDRDEDTGKLVNDAISMRGQRALGVCRIVNLKDRIKGLADTEITLDGDYWTTVDEEVQRALLDHELHHIALKISKGIILHDAAGRPKIKMRKHDVEIGWFKSIAERHGKHSMEQQQAAHIMDMCGQYFWPLLAPPPTSKAIGNLVSPMAKNTSISSMTISSGKSSVTITNEDAKRIRKAIETLDK